MKILDEFGSIHPDAFQVTIKQVDEDDGVIIPHEHVLDGQITMAERVRNVAPRKIAED